MQTTFHTEPKNAPPSSTPVGGGLLQRKCACGGAAGLSGECGDCDKKKLSLQRSTEGAEPETRNSAGVPPIVQEVLRARGQPLDQQTRAFMELRLGHDFSKVRVHTDARAAESASSVNALAYTVGQHVVFGTEQYRPDSAQGRSLLAHELTHTIQQASGSQESSQIEAINSNDAAEIEANKAEDKLAYGEGLRSTVVSSGVLARKPDPDASISNPVASTSSPAQTSGAGETGVKCSPVPLDVTKLPGVMDAKGWIHGAKLMRQWFANSGTGPTDTTTITMDWVLGFTRAKEKYDAIFSEKIYVSEKAQVEIGKLLKSQGLLGSLGSATRVFGFSLPVSTLHPRYYVTYQTAGSVFDPIDALFAALGKFTYRVVVGGVVTEEAGQGGSGKRTKVAINEVGVYVSDSYDFEDHQLLGCWNVCTNVVEKGGVLCVGSAAVTNGDFRDWRAKNGKGGDYTILSDLKTKSLQTPETFYLP